MKIISRSVNDTLKIGKIIAKNLRSGDIICLFGTLGSGKTVMAKGIAEGLGIKKEKVISPSFVLMRRHARGKFPLFHFDFYRLKTPEDILALGYQDYLYAEGISVIEWADRLGYLLPGELLKVELLLGADSKRQLNFFAFGERYKKLLKKIYEDIRD